MKQTPLILSIIAVVAAAAALILSLTAPKNQHKPAESADGIQAVAGDIVYLRLDTLMMQYDMYSDLQSAFEAKAQTVDSDLNKKARKLDSDIKNFQNQIQKGLLTRSAAEQQNSSLEQRQANLQNEAAQKQQELAEESQVLMNQVMYAIKTYLEEYNKEHNFAAILTTTDATNIVITGSPALDITQEIVDGLNAEYIKTRNTGAAKKTEE
ncbi:MAG: OmpH family outer membrane protein [Bacteroidales bacterium]|nr:OmpH family outer membrane protein [Bacteroidales bacterium]